MWQHDLDRIWHFRIDPRAGMRRGKRTHFSVQVEYKLWYWREAHSWTCHVLGVTVKSFNFSPSGANLQAYSLSECTPTHKPIHTDALTNQHGHAATNPVHRQQWFGMLCMVILWSISSQVTLIRLNFKRCIILWALPQGLELNPKMNSALPPTQLKGTK